MYIIVSVLKDRHHNYYQRRVPSVRCKYAWVMYQFCTFKLISETSMQCVQWQVATVCNVEKLTGRVHALVHTKHEGGLPREFPLKIN